MDHRAIARACLDAALNDTLAFPQIVGRLAEAGFEGYLCDFRRGVVSYYRSDGETLELEAHLSRTPIAPTFDADAVRAAVAEAQARVAGYSYRGFCAKVTAAGCAGYIVSILGRRALYFGRTAETHVEPFPQ